MRTGIEISPGVFIRYKSIIMLDCDRVCLGEQIYYNVINAEALQRIKNYILMGHPVLDDVGVGEGESYEE